MEIPKHDLSDFVYELPEGHIAQEPLSERSASKLLCFDGSKIEHRQFSDIASVLPHNAHLVYNNTKVIPARLLMQKDTGALIEIFLLKPAGREASIEKQMSSTTTVVWNCIIGNLKRWRDGQKLTAKLLHNGNPVTLTAELVERTSKRVQLYWTTQLSFSEVLSIAGKTPLPPYIHRELSDDDRQRYQTVYSKHEGAVAAPTAGLHFTDSILEEIASKQLIISELTLHVSAGTFQPVLVDEVSKHPMHAERIRVDASTIDRLLGDHECLVPVGTTSLRTLESLYWIAQKLQHLKATNTALETDVFELGTPFPYDHHETRLGRREALNTLLAYVHTEKIDFIEADTSLMIVPGYKIRMCDALITNFHLPGSTLIMLIAALIGKNWRSVYAEALVENYRFLSYGDSSILWNSNQ